MSTRQFGWAVTALLCSCVLCNVGTMRQASAQGFLKELEDKVRGSIENAIPADPKQQPPNNALRPEVLPAPAAGGTTAPGGTQLNGPTTVPPTPGPLSILEPPTTLGTQPPGTQILGGRAPAGQPQLMQPPAEDGAPIYLGIETEPNIGGGIGVRIVTVTQDSPAWRAGFRIGDVIQAVDGFAISDLDVLADRLSRKRAGETVKFLVLRAGRNTELTAVLQDASIAQRVHGFVPQSGPSAAGVPSGPAYFGVSVADLSAAFRTQFAIKVFRGAAVTNVAKGSPADLAGIQPGEVITKVNGRTVEASQDIVNWIASARPGDVAQLTVLHGQQPRQVDVALSMDPRYAASIPPGVSPTMQTNEEVALLRGEVQQLRDELAATRALVEQLAKQVDELTQK